ncbi:hypothetical protein DdX_04467 [Ditylenchus destructor]|uniref:Uncharacterized protein n=1 Tax=Ditylenchus destructor TaxID=166010 RepID=A0AAD4NEK9_9BILA|nr:hypothetical protein DdX_04467 [Ditylenchus destructor]
MIYGTTGLSGGKSLWPLRASPARAPVCMNDSSKQRRLCKKWGPYGKECKHTAAVWLNGNALADDTKQWA